MRKPILKRRWIWISVVAVVAACVLVLAFSPQLLKLSLEQVLRDHVADEVSIHKVEIDYLNTEVKISDLELHSAGKSVLKLASLKVTPRLSSLLQLHISLDKVTIENASVYLKGIKSGELRLGKFILLKRPIETKPSTTLETVKGDDSLEHSFSVKIITAVNSRIDVNYPSLDTTLMINRLQLDDLSKLEIDQIEVQDSILRLTDLDAADEGKNKKILRKRRDATPASGFNFNINEIKSRGRNRINVLDQTIVPSIEFSLNTDFSIGKIDSSKPNLSTPFIFSGTDESLRLALTGTAELFSPASVVDLTGDIEGISLSDASPLINQHLGFNVDTGELNGKLNLRIGEGKLDGSLMLIIRHLAVTTADKKKLAKLEEKMPVSLQRAVALLRKKDGTIQVTVPITGDISGLDFDFNFDLSNAVNRGLEGVGRAYIFLLAPLLTPMVQHVIKRKRDLKPIYFEAGSTELNDKGNKHTEVIGKYLTRKKTTSIAVCGWAVHQDREKIPATNLPKESDKIKASLLKLATNRATKVKRILREKFKIDKNRLIACRPIIEKKGQTYVGVEEESYKIPKKRRGKPRVDIFRSK